MNDLEARIQELELLHTRQITALRQSAAGLVESMSPSNLLRTALKDITHAPDLRQSVVNAAIGLGAGYLGKKIYVGQSDNIFKKIAGSGLQFLLANFIRKKIPYIREQLEPHQVEE